MPKKQPKNSPMQINETNLTDRARSALYYAGGSLPLTELMDRAWISPSKRDLVLKQLPHRVVSRNPTVIQLAE